MEEYFENFREGASILHPVVMSAVLHERLVTIHPFVDGNGRTARLVMNLLLLQHGFPLAIIGGDYDSRMAYYDALEQVQTGEKPSAFVNFIMVHVREILKRYITIFEGYSPST
jgi:Fic family protein